MFLGILLSFCLCLRDRNCRVVSSTAVFLKDNFVLLTAKESQTTHSSNFSLCLCEIEITSETEAKSLLVYLVVLMSVPTTIHKYQRLTHCTRIAPSLPTSTPSPWLLDLASTTTCAPSPGRMAPLPPSPSRIPTSRVRVCVVGFAVHLTCFVQPLTARATKLVLEDRARSYVGLMK